MMRFGKAAEKQVYHGARVCKMILEVRRRQLTSSSSSSGGRFLSPAKFSTDSSSSL
jgi:hypothetical protein